VNTQILRRRAKQMAVIFAVWTGLALIPGVQAHAYIASLGHPISWARALLPPLLNHWIWAALTPGVLWLSARYPIERRSWARIAGIHFPASLAFAALHVTLRLPFIQSATLFTTRPARISWALFRNSMFANYYDDLWTYSTLVVFEQLWDYYRKYKDRELRATKLEAQLAQAQLQVLKMQLNPHFLFNTLHAISSLMHEDVEAADNMMTGLSDLLRMSLENVNEQEVTLKREMEFLQGYLEIQQIRFRDRLVVKIEVPADALDALVPNMVLQPLVENAVTHGVAPKSAAGEICIRAQKDNGMLRLEVADNGKGMPGDAQDLSSAGLGLANTTTRLRQLYGEQQRFRIEKGAAGGTVAILEMPFRVAPHLEHEEGRHGGPNHHRG